MPSERARHRLYEEVTEALSPESADELMSYLPPVGWADVATKADLSVIRNEMDALRAELRGEMAELRGEMAELRGELRGEMTELRGEMARGFVSMQRWMVGTMLAFMTLFSALVLGVIQLTR
jgi:hypothetical protein